MLRKTLRLLLSLPVTKDAIASKQYKETKQTGGVEDVDVQVQGGPGPSSVI